MKNLLKFVLFLIYTLCVFLLKDYMWLAIVVIINLLSIRLFKISYKKSLIALSKISVFVLITTMFNVLFVDVHTAILIGTRLLIVCNTTYIFSSIYSYTNLADAIETLAYPIKWMGGNPKDIGLLVCISVAFIPILKKELEDLRDVLVVKGFTVQFFKILKNLNLILKPFFILLLQRVNEIEASLKAKAYQE